MQFTPEMPFPLLKDDSYTYEDSKSHAVLVDVFLGLETEKVESKIAANVKYRNDKVQNRSEYWVGLAIQTLQTPYVEIRSLLDKLNPKSNETIVDLGSGYGRMGHVIGHHYPEVNYIGYEYVDERVNESQRCLNIHYYPRVKVERADLSSPEFTLIPAEYYFLYDFGSRSAIEKTLQDLRLIAQTKSVTVIGRGRSSRDAIERCHPWLSEIKTPQHFKQYSIYYS